MGLNEKQKEAVEYLDGPILVLAGPGTGKTQLLSSKVEYILKNTDTNPENILCITFTDSGAENMRERLATMIGQAASDVRIYTYHAFGSDILKQYVNYTDAPERRLESAIDGVMQQKFIREIQSKLPVQDILKKSAVADIVSTIQNAKSARLTASDLREIAAQNIWDSQEISNEVSPILQNLARGMKFDKAVEEIYRPIQMVLAQYISKDDEDTIWARTGINRLANEYLLELTKIIEEESAKEKPSISPLTKWKNKRFELDSDGNYRLSDWIANKKLASIAEIMDKYDQRLREEGLFDFADMIEEAIRALKEDRGFRLTMQERFQYVLLDEFQDTNPSQFELIKLLTDYENPLVMAVGDDDQAIFEFQGANASNLLDFQRHYNAYLVKLVDNYRSQGEILEFSHKVAEQIDLSFSKAQNIEKRLRANIGSYKSDDESVTNQIISRHEFSAAQDEYYWISLQIRKLIDAGVFAKDIAVIAPKHKYLLPLLPHLKNQNIEIAYEKRSNILEDSKIHELLVLSRFVHDLASEKQPSSKLLEILSFPFWGVAPEIAVEAVRSEYRDPRSTLGYLMSSEDEKIRGIATILANLVQLSFESPIELVLDYMIGKQKIAVKATNTSILAQNDEKVKNSEGAGLNLQIQSSELVSPYLAYYSQNSTPGELLEFYENLNTLRDLAKNHLQIEKPKLKDLITLLDDYEAAGAAVVTTSIYQDSADAVQLMSAHKSKGLEFAYVFMLAVDDMAWGKSKGNNNLLALPANLIGIRHTGVTDDERLRLLFVSITRAKYYLIMTNSIYDFNNKEVKRLSYLNEARDEKNSNPISPYLPEDSGEIQLHYDDFDTETKLELTETSWLSNYFKLKPNVREILKKRMEGHYLSATELTQFIDIVYAGPESVYQNTILRAPRDADSIAMTFGSLVHAVFERITKEGISDAEAVEYFRQEARKQALPEDELNDLIASGEHNLPIDLQAFGDIIRANGAKAEVNMSSERIRFENIPLSGKIDLMKVDDAAKTIEVYDFKTGKYYDSKWESNPTLYKYSLQLGFYKLLLNLSLTYQKYKVTKGHILFVSPDAEDKVYDKEYIYNDKDDEILKQLIRSVYYQITSLEFLDDPEILISADKANTMKQVREFVKLLIGKSQA